MDKALPDIEKRVTATIVDIHNFFTDWVNGTCPGDPETFKKNALDRISDSIVAVFPSGNSFGKQDFKGYMQSIYGSNPAFRIKIRDIQLRHHVGDVVMVSYKEWQRDAKDSDEPNNGRQTSMLMRDRDADGLEILMVHETWLPEDVVKNGDFNF